MEIEPIIAVCGKWIFKKNKWCFAVDKRGSKVLDVNVKNPSHSELLKMVTEDYKLDRRNCEIRLSYMFSKELLVKLPHDTPPVFVDSTRQLKGFLGQRKNEHLRLCVEVIDHEFAEVIEEDTVTLKKRRTSSSKPSTEDAKEEAIDDNSSGCKRAKVKESCGDEGNGNNVEKSEEVSMIRNAEEDDEFDSRFDYFDDSDGASSDDDNFSIYGMEPEEESPTLPPKKRLQNATTEESKSRGLDEFLKLEMCSLNIAVGQRYASKEALENRLKLLSLIHRFDFDVPTSRLDLVIIQCFVKGCTWRIRASPTGNSPEFHIRVYVPEHTCSITERSTRSRQATPDLLGELWLNFLGSTEHTTKPKHVGDVIAHRFKITMDYWKSHRTLQYARLLETGTPERGFEELPSYLHMIRRANPGTVTSLQIDECQKFKYVFIAFGASISGFTFMRKVVVVDGTFLQGKYKGTLLIASAQDGNFQIYPIAFGVVDTENDESWEWFFTQLASVIPDSRSLAIISDRHNSIGKAIGKVYPLAARGICTYHLYKNILVRFKGEGSLFRLVKKAAKCYRLSDFEATFKEIEEQNPELHGYLQRADVHMWARAHFPGNRYNLTTTNIAESMNKALRGARCLPIVRLLEAVRTMLTRWFAERREDAMSMKTTLTRGVENLLKDRVTAAKLASVQKIDSAHFQVTIGTYMHVVNLDCLRCSCKRFDIEKLPCMHAIAAAEKTEKSRITLCHPYYSKEYLVNAYLGVVMPSDSALPVPAHIEEQVCTPPDVRQPPGRPTKSRLKSCLEVALEKKKHPRKQHTCSRCKQAGHNAKTCKVVGV